MATTSEPENVRTAEHRYLFDITSWRLSVMIENGVVEGVAGEVLKGFGALRRRGAEIGGLLLGHESVEGHKTITVVEAFDPIPIEYLSGPSYHLSEADRGNLDQRLGMWRQSSEHRLWVVGLYRSHTRQDFEIDEQDKAICSHVLADRRGLFLLIKPALTRPPMAGMFLWQNGALERNKECPDFPFVPATAPPAHAPAAAPPRLRPVASSAGAGPVSPPLNGGKQPAGLEENPRRFSAVRPAPEPLRDWAPSAVDASALAEVAGKPDFMPAGPPPEIVQPPPDSQRLRWTVIAVAALVIALTGWHFVGRGSQRAPALTPVSTLDLAASDREGQLEIEWNRSAPIVQEATRGSLTIADGPVNKEMAFDGEQIRSMRKVLYKRLTGEVRLRFEVVAGDRSQSESIRFISPGSAAAEPASGGTGAVGLEAVTSRPAAAPPPARQPARATAGPPSLAPSGGDRRLPPTRAGTALVGSAVNAPKPAPAVDAAPPVVSDAKPADLIETGEQPREIPKPGRRR